MYYIYELNMPEEVKEKLVQTAAERGVTTDELVQSWLEWAVEHKAEFEEMVKNHKALSEEERAKGEAIKIVRSYPVHDGESEAEAKLRALREETGRTLGPLSNDVETMMLPMISEEEFCEHVEDENFYEKYGNPCVIVGKDGRKIVFESFALYKRDMHLAGMDDELAEIEKQIEEDGRRQKEAGGV